MCKLFSLSQVFSSIVYYTKRHVSRGLIGTGLIRSLHIWSKSACLQVTLYLFSCVSMSGFEVFGALMEAGACVKALVHYGKAWYHAPEEIENLKEQIQLAIDVLQDVEQTYQEFTPKTQEELKLPNALINAITQFKGLVQKIKNKFSGRSRRIKWLALRSDINGDVEAIKEYYAIFQLSMQTMQMKLQQQQSTKEDVSKLQDTVDVNQRWSIFQDNIDWLFEPGSVVQEPEFRNELQSCRYSEPRWILEQKGYEDWQSDSPNMSNWLWGLGRQGAGKSTIASFLAHELRYGKALTQKDSRLEVPHYANPGVAIFYCSYSEQSKQDVDMMFRCISRQLLTQLRTVDPSKTLEKGELVNELRDRSIRQVEIANPNEEEFRPVDTKSLLIELLHEFARPYIIIDALNEYPGNVGELLDQLVQLSATSVRIFVTSRHGDGGLMKDRAANLRANILHISPSDAEICSYVGPRLERIRDGKDNYLSARSALVERLQNDHKRQTIAQKIISSADGSFLLATLQINTLRDSRDDNELEERLNDIPSSLEGIIDDAISRIEKQNDRVSRFVGQKALLWVTCARRPLTVPELAQCLATYRYLGLGLEAANIRTKDCPKPESLVEATGYFLHIEENSTTIHVHETVRKYCKQSDVRERYFVDAEYEMAQICLRYLTLDNFSSGHCTSEEEWRRRCQQYPFLDYAASHWGSHMKLSPQRRFLNDPRYPVLEFLDMTGPIASAGQALWPNPNTSGLPLYAPQAQDWPSLKQNNHPIMPALHLLSYFDLPRIAEKWIEQAKKEVDQPSHQGFTPLYLACRLGRQAMVELLLKHKANPTRRTGHKLSSLVPAVRHGHEEVVKVLLRHESASQLVRLGNAWERQPLCIAIVNQGKEMVQIILEFLDTLDDGKDLLLHQDNQGYGPLHVAANRNKTDVMEILTKRPGGEALLHQRSRNWQDTPLHLASVMANAESIKTLLKLGADLAATQSQGKTPLHLATQYPEVQHASIVKLLLESGADPNLQDKKGRTALHEAVYHGHAGNLQTVLDDGHIMTLDVQDTEGRTALHGAVKERKGDYLRMTRMLLQAGSDALKQDRSGQTALYCAIASRDRGLIDVFMDHPQYNNEILFIGIRSDQPWLVERLLNGPAGTWPTLHRGQTTVLHVAAQSGFTEVVHLILGRDKSKELLEKRNTGGRTPILIATAREHVEIVEALAAAGANVNAQGGAGNTALHLAVEIDLPEVVELLLNADAKLDITNNDGQTPYAQALASGSEDCAALLAAADRAAATELSGSEPQLTDSNPKSSHTKLDIIHPVFPSRDRCAKSAIL